MKTQLILCIVLLGTAAAATPAQQEAAQSSTLSELTPAEKAAGWNLLFDGKTTTGWRGYGQKGFPIKGWAVADGCLKTVAGEQGGDIITVDQYTDFELCLEWRVGEKGNSGIMYRVTEKHGASWQTGPEYQLLDDAGHGFPPTGVQSAGAVYGLYAPSDKKPAAPAGQFNHARIRLKDGRVTHWLNGVKIVECHLDSDEWKERIAASKFKKYEGFGLQPSGHIALQAHGNEVWFRNIKVRDLTAPLPDEIRLFSGKDLTGWTAYLQPQAGVQMADVWTEKGGVLICKGQPTGYIRTEADYTNYILKLEWRFDPAKGAGNSGVLLRMIGPDKVWPRSVEAQLQSGDAGDFWNIDEFPMKVDPARTKGRNTRKIHFAEYPIGDWNEYEIIVNGGSVVLYVNGEKLNEAWDVLETPGKIGLQSEGAEIHFRNIRLAPIK